MATTRDTGLDIGRDTGCGCECNMICLWDHYGETWRYDSRCGTQIHNGEEALRFYNLQHICKTLVAVYSVNTTIFLVKGFNYTRNKIYPDISLRYEQTLCASRKYKCMWYWIAPTNPNYYISSIYLLSLYINIYI